MFQKLLQWCTANRSLIIKLFQIGYLLGGVLYVAAIWILSTSSPLMTLLFELAGKIGEGAVLLFVAVTLPGILGRFGIKHPLITIGIMFRRYTGLAMYEAGFVHGSIEYLLPVLIARSPLLPIPTQVLFGTLTLVLLFPLALTSNNFSVQKLGKNWKRLHKIIYIAFWLIFLHIALLGEKTWSGLIGVTGVLEILSLLYDFLKKKNTPPVTPSPAAVPPPTPPQQTPPQVVA